MSASEYLAWEREQPDKHELHAGEVFAMAGGSPRHNLLSARVLVQLSLLARAFARAAERSGPPNRSALPIPGVEKSGEPLRSAFPERGDFATALSAALRGCHVLSSDQRIAAADDRYVYADCVAVCGELRMAPGTSDVLASPTVVVEVLSKTTERYDRGDKWAAYQRLPSLTDYLLVAQQTPRIEHYRRELAREWRYSVHDAGGTIQLASGATLVVDTLYEGDFELPSD